MNYSKKTADIAPSLTLEIAARARAMSQEGIEVINLSIGEPDFDTPAYIRQAASAAIQEGRTRYTAVGGIPPLKEALARHYQKKGVLARPEEILVSTGAKQALYNALVALINPGDQVLIPVPYWLSYPEMVKLAEGQPVLVPPNSEGKLTPDQLKKYAGNKAKVLILNNPSNPSGVVYGRQELADLAQACREEGIFILADEVYERLSYQGPACSLGEISSDILDHGMIVSGFSKAYAMTGWRLGYALAHRDLIDRMTRVQAHTTSNPTSISQYAGLAALTQEDGSVEAMVEEFRKRRDYFVGGLRDLGLAMYQPAGAFYVFTSIGDFLGRKIRGQEVQGSEDFCRLLLDQCQIAAVPGRAFGQDDYIRFSYAQGRPQLEEAINRLEKLVKEVYDD